MKNKVFNKLICVMLAVSLCFSYFALTASATSLTDELIEFSCAEPPADSNNGYLIIFYKTTSDKIMGKLLAWNVTPAVNSTTENTVSTVPSVQINIATYVSIRFQGQGLAYYSLYDVVSDTNNFNGVQYGMIDYTETGVYRMQISPNDYLGYALYGNGVVTSNSYPSENELYPVLFNEGKTQYNQMLQLINACQQLGVKIDDTNMMLEDIDAWMLELYLQLADVIGPYLSDISNYTYQSQEYLLQCRDLLEEIRDCLNIEGPSYDDMTNEDFQNAMGDYNADSAVEDLPDIYDGDKYEVTAGISIFRSIFNLIFHYMPELKVALTLILMLGFIGYVLGRKLNKS